MTAPPGHRGPDRSDEPPALPEVAYVIRVATVYLVVEHDTSDRVEYASRLVAALEEDPRVTDAYVPELDTRVPQLI